MQSLFSQSISSIDYLKWSDPSMFTLSPSPIIKGYGYFSDSLSKANNDKIFYVHNNEYYCIESWADYYYWFTLEYKHLFEDPQLYAYYYWSNDNFGMASYIASNKYLGKYYPSSIQINFGNQPVENNRLGSSKFIAEKDNMKIEEVKKQFQTQNEINKTTKEQKQLKEAPEIFQKDQFRKNKLENNAQRIDATETSKNSMPEKTR